MLQFSKYWKTKIHYLRIWLHHRTCHRQTFVNNILFIDEALSTRWDNENPHEVREARFQHELKVNVWCAIFRDNSIGLFKLPAKLNGDSSLKFLHNTLFDELGKLPCNQRRDIWFMHDDAPPQQIENATQSQRIIATNKQRIIATNRKCRQFY